MPRRASFVVLTALVFLAFAQPARAGGSWIEVSGSRHVRIGTWELGYAGAGTQVVSDIRDLAPTVCRLLEVPPPWPMEGVALADLAGA